MVQRFVGELPGAFKIGAQVFSFDGFQIQTEGQIIVIAPFAPGRQQADAHAQIPDGALIGGSVFGLASGHEVEFGDPEFFLVLFDVLEPCIEQLGYIKAVFGDVPPVPFARSAGRPSVNASIFRRFLGSRS